MLTCELCGARVEDTENPDDPDDTQAAVEEGWEPAFDILVDGDPDPVECDGPICGECVRTRTTPGPHGAPLLRPEYYHLIPEAGR